MIDTLQPGELELRTDPPPADVVAPVLPTVASEAVPEPVAIVASPEAGPEPVVEPEPAADVVEKPRKPGMLEELIETRTRLKQAEGHLKSLSPVLSRLTPEVQEAIAEGRLVVQPRQAAPDAERERLKSVAETLGLLKADNTPDIDAARRVDTYVQGTVKQHVAPLHHASLTGQAKVNVDKALAFATEHGYDVDTVRETFMDVLNQPNGAAMLAQAKVAETVWFQAVGRATAAGKLPTKAAPVKAATPAAVITEGTGRRGAPASSVQLSPQLAKVYRDNGMDPAKMRSATKPPTVDPRGSMELE